MSLPLSMSGSRLYMYLYGLCHFMITADITHLLSYRIVTSSYQSMQYLDMSMMPPTYYYTILYYTIVVVVDMYSVVPTELRLCVIYYIETLNLLNVGATV